MRYIFMGNENSYLNRAFVNLPDKKELACIERKREEKSEGESERKKEKGKRF